MLFEDKFLLYILSIIFFLHITNFDIGLMILNKALNLMEELELLNNKM